MSTHVHQEVHFEASPSVVYETLMDAEKHAAFCGNAATSISREPGGAFSCHDGQILGRSIELVENSRIVQAWRVAGWPEGVFSLVRIGLEADGDGTRLTLDHTGIPEGFSTRLAAGWEARYWTPMKACLTR